MGGVCSLANYSVAYEETKSNRVFDFRGFVCSLFPQAFDFYLYLAFVLLLIYSKPSSFLCLRNALLRDCDIFWVFLLIDYNM